MEKLNDKKTFREALAYLNIKLIDTYIIRKFLGTFFFCLVLILTIAVVFDFAEKIDNFMERQAYLNIKLIDTYIIRKFLGTFFFCLVLILTIAVVFDFAEKIDNFMERQA